MAGAGPIGPGTNRSLIIPFLHLLPRDLFRTPFLSDHPWLWIWVSVTNLPVLRLMWNHVICSDEIEKSEDAAEDSHPITPTLDGNNELRIIQPTSSSSPTVFPLSTLFYRWKTPRKHHKNPQKKHE